MSRRSVHLLRSNHKMDIPVLQIFNEGLRQLEHFQQKYTIEVGQRDGKCFWNSLHWNNEKWIPMGLVDIRYTYQLSWLLNREFGCYTFKSKPVSDSSYVIIFWFYAEIRVIKCDSTFQSNASVINWRFYQDLVESSRQNCILESFKRKLQKNRFCFIIHGVCSPCTLPTYNWIMLVLCSMSYTFTNLNSWKRFINNAIRATYKRDINLLKIKTVWPYYENYTIEWNDYWKSYLLSTTALFRKRENLWYKQYVRSTRKIYNRVSAENFSVEGNVDIK